MFKTKAITPCQSLSCVKAMHYGPVPGHGAASNWAVMTPHLYYSVGGKKKDFFRERQRRGGGFAHH